METSPDKHALLRMLLGEGIPDDRLTQLLEAANGRVEQAVDIYFHQQSSPQQHNPASRQVSTSPRTSGTKQKQARLDSFFGSRKRPSTSSSPSSSSSASITKHSKQKSADSETLPIASSSPQWSQQYHQNTNDSVDQAQESHPSPSTTAPALPKKQQQQPQAKDAVDMTLSGTNDSHQSKEEEEHGVHQNNTLIYSFQQLSQVLQEMADTTKRTVKLQALETYIRSILTMTAEEETSSLAGSSSTNKQSNVTNDSWIMFQTRVLCAALDLVLGGRSVTTLAPLNVSESAISKAITTRLGVSRMQLSQAYRRYGDLGDCAASLFIPNKGFFFVAKKSQQLQKQKLSILDVSEALIRIRTTEGRDAKQQIVQQLFRRCDSRTEIRFLARLLVGNMRIGANLKTILAALTMAIMPPPDMEPSMSSKEAITLVQKTHDICPSLEKIIEALLKGGMEQMRVDCTIQVLIPIAPMLAHPIHCIEEVQKAMGAVSVGSDTNDTSGHDGEIPKSQNSIVMEFKFDGMRCQAHYNGTSIKLFSRHMLEITNQFPDVAKYMLDAAKKSANGDVSSFIIDSEIVAVEGERLLPFQDLSTRRKKNETENIEGVQVKVFAFDLMYVNGQACTNAPLWKRKQLLHQDFVETSDFAFVESEKLDTYNKDRLTQYLSNAVEKGAEGLMLKLLGTTDPDEGRLATPTNTCAYEAGTRSRSWLKMKRDYVAGYSDTIDVVPIGAWYGNGRKAQKSFLSPVLLAVYDDEEDVFRSISRCLSYSDKMFESMREFYLHGTPYPVEVDVAADTEIQHSEGGVTILENIAESDGNETESENETIREEGDKHASESCSNTDNEANGDRVNCFPNRPSSAFVVTNESPPIWFKPLEVFEVSFADLSLSPKHTAAAGLVDSAEARGVALRFCRFKRRRPDKKPEQATTSLEIAQLFARQSKTGTRSRGQVRHSL